ncbi:6609_t:CDS:2 [Dentiscutata erythropus]|uniref:6609_t:CDS:1 n=1 Tax=Dentiscutata erythropus TaxID=1348616 RepID=A0A9N9DJV1_9GLOM|nr:6609_t:CDS:2 [Dentiscutata erythropus]
MNQTTTQIIGIQPQNNNGQLRRPQNIGGPQNANRHLQRTPTIGMPPLISQSNANLFASTFIDDLINGASFP